MEGVGVLVGENVSVGVGDAQTPVGVFVGVSVCVGVIVAHVPVGVGVGGINGGLLIVF